MIKILIDPFNILLFFVVVCLIARICKLRYFKWVLAATLGWFYIISTPFIPNLVLHSLESRYDPIDNEQISELKLEAIHHIVVLGGGHGFDDRLPPNSLLTSQALARLNEGVRLHRMLPNSILILSGYSSSGRTTQAEMLYLAALQLGVKDENMKMQTEPSNTNEEASIYFEKFGTANSLILVTSAAHMPRSIEAFSRNGLKPIASPAHYRLIGGPKMKRWWLPSIRNISHLKTGINEHAAICRDWWLE